MSEKGYQEVNRRVLVGEQRRPFRPDELADRRPILGTGKLPEELLAMRRHRSIFIAGEDAKQPEVAITRLERPLDAAHEGGWRIDTTLDGEQQPTVMPRVRAIREDPDVYRKASIRLSDTLATDPNGWTSFTFHDCYRDMSSRAYATYQWANHEPVVGFWSGRSTALPRY